MTLEEIKQLYRRHVDLHWHQGKQWQKDDPILAEDYVGHNLVAEVHGVAEYNAFNLGLRTAFPDLRLTIEGEIAEGDRGAFLWTMRGTHKGDLMGVPPTGKPISMSGTSIIRVAGGKIVESWAHPDFLGMFRQLGVSPPLANG